MKTNDTHFRKTTTWLRFEGKITNLGETNVHVQELRWLNDTLIQFHSFFFFNLSVRKRKREIFLESWMFNGNEKLSDWMKERKACWSEDPREDAGSEIEKCTYKRKPWASLFSYFILSNVAPYIFNATYYYYWLFTILIFEDIFWKIILFVIFFFRNL